MEACNEWAPDTPAGAPNIRSSLGDFGAGRAVALWGMAAWGFLPPQQARLIDIVGLYAIRGKVIKASRPPAGTFDRTTSPPWPRTIASAAVKPRPTPPVVRLRELSSR